MQISGFCVHYILATWFGVSNLVYLVYLVTKAAHATVEVNMDFIENVLLNFIF
jgi:hypothetical protein